jgi:hypothetical protein
LDDVLDQSTIYILTHPLETPLASGGVSGTTTSLLPKLSLMNVSGGW